MTGGGSKYSIHGAAEFVHRNRCILHSLVEAYEYLHHVGQLEIRKERQAKEFGR